MPCFSGAFEKLTICQFSSPRGVENGTLIEALIPYHTGLSAVLKIWIGFTVSEKVNPGEPGGTKPRVRWTGAGFVQRIMLADAVYSWKGQPGCRRSRAVG